MFMNVKSPFDKTEAPLVVVLTTPIDGVEFGYQVGGVSAGPHLVVAGHGPIADLVFERIIALPTIGWIKGTLSLISLDALEQPGLAFNLGNLIDPKPDEIHFLPYQLDKAFHTASAARGYWSTLRLCCRFGMISGRRARAGVAAKTTEGQ